MDSWIFSLSVNFLPFKTPHSSSWWLNMLISKIVYLLILELINWFSCKGKPNAYLQVWLFPGSASSITSAQSVITVDGFPIDLQVRCCCPSETPQHQECWQKQRGQHVNSRGHVSPLRTAPGHMPCFAAVIKDPWKRASPVVYDEDAHTHKCLQIHIYRQPRFIWVNSCLNNHPALKNLFEEACVS